MNTLKAPRLFAKRHGKSQGQALVETALVTVFLLLLLSVAVDVGRAFFTVVALQNAVGEGALYGSAFPARWASTGRYRYPNPDNIDYRTKNESVNSPWLVASQVTVRTRFVTPGGAAGTPIEVSATYPFQLIGPLPGLLGFSRTLTLTAQAQQTILTQVSSP